MDLRRFSRCQTQQLLSATAVSAGLLLCFGQGLHAERAQERLDQAETLQASLRQQAEARAELLADRPYRITPERRALLNTIRYAEGTWKDGRDHGYRVLYGGSLFQDLSRHPEKVVVKRYSSAAAGAYQFLPGTWRQVARELKLPSFEPQHQDQAALRLVERRGALEEVDRHGLTPKVMHQLAPEWASFPTHAGTSAYGQPVKSHAELARFYSRNLDAIRQGA
jgi:Muramidase (phage lambda lysozyme)